MKTELKTISKLRKAVSICSLFASVCLPVSGQVSDGLHQITNREEILSTFELLKHPLMWYVWQIERTGYDLTDPAGLVANDEVKSTLRMFGTNAVPRLIQEVVQTNSSVEANCRIENAVFALGIIGPDAKEATHVLLNLLNNPGIRVPALAIQTLGKIHSDEKIVIPALLPLIKYPPRYTNSQQFRNHKMALIALGEYGNVAKAAVPMILKTLNNTNAFCGKEALEALQKIDPDAAEKFINRTGTK